MKAVLVFSTMLLITLLQTTGSSQTIRREVPFSWPSIKNVTANLQFPNAAKAHVDLPIQGADGKPLYRFSCDPGFTFNDGAIASFECYLNHPYASKEPDLSLLNVDPFDGAVAHSRGEILAQELVGKCRDYPGWGDERTFTLRGMSLRIEMSDIVLSQERNPAEGDTPKQEPSIRSFNFRLTVTPEKSAVSAVALPVPFYLNWTDPNAPFSSAMNCNRTLLLHVPGEVSNRYLATNNLLPPFPQISPNQTTFHLSGEWESSYSPIPTPTEPSFFVNAPIPPRGRIVYWPIGDADGKLAYEFECTAQSGGPANPKIQGYGISCGLFASGGKVNLLADSIDPYSRMVSSQILPDQLHGECANYPQWGSERVFALRGFKLTMHFTNAAFTQSDLAGYALKWVTLALRVEPDSSAKSPVAPPSKYIYWGFDDRPNACDRVLVNPSLARGHE